MWLQIFIALFILYVFANLKELKDYLYKIKVARNIPNFGHVPFIGSILYVPLEFEKFTQFYIDFAKKTLDEGHSVMSAWFFTDFTVVPLTGDAVKVITNSSVELKKGRDYKFVERWLGPALLLGDGERWHKTRKLVTPGFHFQKLEEFAPIMDRHCRTLVSNLRQIEDGVDANIFSNIKNCALDIIAETAMGVHLDAQRNAETPYVQAVKTFNKLAVIASQKPHYFFFNELGWKLSGYEKETVKTLDILKDMTDKVIKERVEQQDHGEFHEVQKPDFLGILLKSYAEGELPFENLREEVDTFMFAGHDTISHAVGWTIWSLACHQDVQEKLHQEIETEFSGRDDEFVSPKLKSLPYLEKVFKEALRIFSPVPIYEREVVNEIEMGGFTIPKGTTVQISPLVLHRNSKAFPDPEKFDPERFADGRQIPSEYIPFSAGPRNCIGQKFAQREAKLMIAHLVHNFKITTDIPFEKNLKTTEVVLAPTLGVPVKLHKRF
ncbi:unnamed protein product [Bursaphelenchus xylophilus]|uniref:(pine wood nematode) hypothetical protein n=1 Tax=Bursaphelenchus xylophilus TaxID=6326 RepID=A0A1I7SPY3_BURXY|nr:unnamed protein product [Bursaphelenchus xylophilus]CAG9109356.1 unnamed protein product [Bursaphelenchus xylophilus]